MHPTLNKNCLNIFAAAMGVFAQATAENSVTEVVGFNVEDCYFTIKIANFNSFCFNAMAHMAFIC